MRSALVVAGKYRLVRELGAGGMGSVWQATHLVTEREVAVKFLHASVAADAGILARFFQEARVSGKLRHPSIIEIFDAGTSPELGGAPFLVMELLDGASLDVVVRKLGRLPPRLVVEAIAECARAVALAHAKGIVHRDLKPANLFLHRPGTGALVPKVLDFGISKIAGAAPEPAAGITATGAVLGSPRYMSPEQAESDKTIDGRSDVHALGVVMWECLLGEPPFHAETYNNLIVQIVTGERPRLDAAWPDAPAGLADLVGRAIARRRDDRFPSADALADALEALLATMPPGPSLTSRTAAAELFGRMPRSDPPPGPPATVREGPAARTAGTTTGGVAMPSGRAAPAAAAPAQAFTPPSAQPLTTSAALAETRPSTEPHPLLRDPSPLAETAPEPWHDPKDVTLASPLPPRPSVPTPARRSRVLPAMVGLVGVTLAAGVAALVVAERHRAEGSTAAETSPAVTPLPRVSASSAPAVSAPVPVASAPAPAGATPAPAPAPAAAPTASEAAATPQGHAGPRVTPVRPNATPAATPRAPPGHAPTRRPDDSVESSGF